MEKLSTTEQVLLAYYVQYYVENTAEALESLQNRLRQGMDSSEYEQAISLLAEAGLVNGTSKDEDKRFEPMITNKGVLFIETLLQIQSYAVETRKLLYVKNSLLTSHLQLTNNVISDYIKQAIQLQES
ncbi:hypothetical protein [Bacillus xiapuensis]|uniref:hypothetical protein n=1 Tax=Bacillus xiapuensis TaxID=2014075 RepID=UPI000C25100F|nr:hypothetical protein [Bacillus xiapuensis]